MVTKYYKNKLIIGNKYEQWVTEQWPLVYNGKIINVYHTQYEQYNIGESREKVEIKNDDIMKRTNRVYIETSEKTDKNNTNYIPSGIYRNDNTLYYLVGDYNEWFIFSKKELQDLDENNPLWLYRPPASPTTTGFCIPKEYIFDYVISHVENKNGYMIETYRR